MVVNRRTFLTITSVMLVILFLFQAATIAEDVMTDFSVNPFVTQAKDSLVASDAVPLSNVVTDRNSFVAYLGDSTDQGVGGMVAQWALYSKRALVSGTSLSAFTFDNNQLPEAILIDSNFLGGDGDVAILTGYAKNGIPLIFCNLPTVDVLGQSQALQDLLGITSVKASDQALTGVQLMGGFLLGGDVIYQAVTKEDEKRQDFKLDAPWYMLHSGSKVYMMGLVQDTTVKNEQLPPLIWRYHTGQAFVFAVNGDYMNDLTALGLLSAMMAETKALSIDPIVNAQVLNFGNFPGLIAENTAVMQTHYNQDSIGVYRDLVWPTLATVSSHNGMVMTTMLAPKLDYSLKAHPSTSDLDYYLQLVQQAGGEMGLSDFSKDGDIAAKLDADSTFFNTAIPQFKFLSMHLAQAETWSGISSTKILENIRTITTTYDRSQPLIGFLDDHVTLLQSTSDGYTHTYRDDFQLRSIQTALGYSSIYVDLAPLVYPQSSSDTWEVLAKEFSSNIGTFWQPFAAFQQTPLSMADQNVRAFLALDYTYQVKGSEITLDIPHFTIAVSFLLRLSGNTLGTITGGTATPVESGVYLIVATGKQVVIDVTHNQELYYHE